MILEKIKEFGNDLKMLEGHDRLQYLVDKAKEGGHDRQVEVAHRRSQQALRLPTFRQKIPSG